MYTKCKSLRLFTYIVSRIAKNNFNRFLSKYMHICICFSFSHFFKHKNINTIKLHFARRMSVRVKELNLLDRMYCI